MNLNSQQKENGAFSNVYVAKKFKELQCFRKVQHVCVTVNTPFFFYTEYNSRHIQSDLRCFESCTKQCMSFKFYFSEQFLNMLKGVTCL